MKMFVGLMSCLIMSLAGADSLSFKKIGSGDQICPDELVSREIKNHTDSLNAKEVKIGILRNIFMDEFEQQVFTFKIDDTNYLGSIELRVGTCEVLTISSYQTYDF